MQIMVPQIIYHNRSFDSSSSFEIDDIQSSAMEEDARRIECFGDGLKFGYINQPMFATIYTNEARPGEIKAYCEGPHSKAICKFTDNMDGSFLLTILPNDVGLHHLHIRYSGHPIPKFPMMISVSAASLVHVHGNGLQSRLLSEAMQDGGLFQVDTGDVDPGSINVKIGGPIGAFKLKTQLNKRDRNQLTCIYNPKVPGLYVISISYDQIIVPNSPHQVYLASDFNDLRRYNMKQCSDA